MCERLDRFLENSTWVSKFPSAFNTHGGATYLDHIPYGFTQMAALASNGKRYFRFETMWAREKAYDNIIVEV